MSKFNAKQMNSNKTTTYEGGEAYVKNLEDEWVNFLFSCILQDRFYESSSQQQDRYIELTNAMIEKYGASFVGKASVFARNELGMRSISELTAAMLNQYQFEGKRDFYKKYFHRPDGVAEVFGAVDMLGGRRSHALVRGACDYLSGLDAYQVGKYKMSGKTYNMYDLINITHANSPAINAYKNDVLEIPDTWETKISGAGSQEEKEAEWKRLVEERKLGYMALIRNLRNILSCSFVNKQWAKEHLVPQITNEVAIKKSLIFPYRIYTAWKMLSDMLMPLEIEMALSDAFITSIGNMPKLEGSSLVVLDVSGSMDGRMSQHSNMRIKEVGAVYAAAMYLSGNDVHFVKFGDNAKWCSYNKYANVFKLINEMQENDGCGYGTDIVPVFNSIEKHYDRMFLISDMQVMSDSSNWCWYGRSKSANDAFKDYKLKYGSTHIYSFDLGNYYSQITNTGSNDISYITALNDTVFKILEFEENGKSLVDVIKDYKY